MLAVITPVLVFIAFLLLLLVSLSVPIIKSIYLFRLVANVSALDSSAKGSVNFGVWGYCISAIDISVLGIKHDTNALCSKAHLGYTFDTTVAKALHVSGFSNLISHATTAALVLHPIATGLTFLMLLTSLFMLRRGSNGTSRFPSLLTLGVGVLAASLTSIVFLIDVIFVAVVRHRVNHDTHNDLELNWGNAVWLTLAATILLWVAMLGACAGVCACGNRYRNRKNAT